MTNSEPRKLCGGERLEEVTYLLRVETLSLRVQPMAESVYHVCFSTKMRKVALVDEVGAEIRRLLKETAVRGSIELLEMETTGDHAHLLIRLQPGQTLSSVMHRLKGTSSRYISLRFPELRVDIGHNAFWQKGYGFRRLSAAQVPAVRRYIRTQAERPLRRN